jgi:farnesyl-diphosphate farnesyltransferase
MEHAMVEPPTDANVCLPDDVLVDELLQGTSRTFALAIPLLQGDRRRQIGLSYLLFRVADSIEDAPECEVPVKLRLLQELRDEVTRPHIKGNDPVAVSTHVLADLCGLWPESSATHRLLCDVPRLLAMLNSTDGSAATAIRAALSQTIDGMTRFLGSSELSPVQIQIQTVQDLRAYCYVVAGIVGEMLTDLFVSHHAVSQDLAGTLRRLSVGFGECLQLTNILKDAESDVLNGRIFIPDGISREAVLSLALRATEDAKRYICMLEMNDFPADIVAFCQFLCLLAEGTLGRLQSAGETGKLTREEVRRLLETVAVPSSNVLV